MTTAMWVIPSGMAVLSLIALVLPTHWTHVVRVLASLYLAGLLATQILNVWRPMDPVSSWFFITVAVLALFGIWYSGPYIAREAEAHHWPASRVQKYYAGFLLFLASLMALALLSNYVFLWAAMEVATLSSVLLVALPDQRASIEAAWKYVMVTEVGGLIALLGTILTLHAIGVPLMTWNPAPKGHLVGGMSAHWALIGAYLALIGYAAKAGLAPFHTWLPDAHSEAPAPVSALLSGLKLSAAVLIIYRLDRLAAVAVPAPYLRMSLIVLGLLSLAVAAVFLAFQRDLKRLWAYSTVEHIGLISLGVGFGGIALVGAMLHIWTHAASKTLLFHNAGTVRILYHSSNAEQGAGNMLRRTPWTGGLLALGSAAIVGLPPFAPFWSEWLILAGGFHQAADRGLALVAALLLVIIFIAVARRIPSWLFAPGQSGFREAQPIREPASLILPNAVLGIVVVASGLGLPWLAHPLWHSLVTELASVHL